MKLDAVDIMRILPHRYPFLLIDRILELEPGVRAVGQKNVSSGEPFFADSLCDRLSMPEVLILETIAQVGAVLLLAGIKAEGQVPALMGIQHAHFHLPVVPGDVLIVTVRVVRLRGNVGWAKGEALVAGNLVCDTAFSFSFIDAP